VQNNPLRYTDPTGHTECDDNAQTWKACQKQGNQNSGGGGGRTQTPTFAPTTTSSPTSTPTPVPTPTGYPLGQAISLLKYSKDGQAAWDYIRAHNIHVDYNTKCQGQGGNPILVNPCGSAVYDAGTFAHEAEHAMIYADNTLFEEYQAFRIGDIVRNDIVTAGVGSSSDLRHPLSVYTINLNNRDMGQLSSDLNTWFNAYEKDYIYKWHLQALPAWISLNLFSSP
jgi:hypothetical protein